MSYGMIVISDWLYLEDDLLVGGFTLRVIRDRMSPVERMQFDASVPFRVE